MPIFKLTKYSFCFILLSNFVGIILQAESLSEHSSALKAYEEYWHNFEKYDNKKLKESKRKYKNKWSNLKKSYDAKLRRQNQDQLNKLKDSVQKYQLQLKEHPDSQNRPFVLLNLAQVYYILSDFRESQEDEDFRTESLRLVKEIEVTYPSFKHIESALYLKAVILEELKLVKKSLQAWTKLARVAKNSKYGLYGIIGVGDYYFEKDSPKRALAYYRRAKDHLGKIEFEGKIEESLRVFYRLAWAAYRTANLSESIEASTTLLSLKPQVRNVSDKERIFKDAMELTGDALYEKNNRKLTQSVLNRKDLQFVADTIGDRILKRFNVNRAYARTVETGRFLVKNFPLSSHLPDWYTIMARSYESLGKEKEKVESYERLAMLLPRNSLWQSQHRKKYKLIAEMKKKSEKAARFVAAYYYDFGIASGSANRFQTAASFYAILHKSLPDAKENSQWQIRQAHCYYFSDRLERAIALYQNLIERVDLSEQQLEVTLYQLALASERSWRKHYAIESPDDKNDRKNVLLKRLAKNTEAFANRFPDNSRSVDLVILTASAYRDSDKSQNAKGFWKRVLVSNPSPAQRLTAMRGLIYAEVHAGNNEKVAKLTSRFLRLENWSKINRNFRQELLGILSSAILRYAAELNKSDASNRAGKLLVSHAKEFKNLPDREKIFRDGGYLLAISDDWRGAQDAAEHYLDEGLAAYRGDILYLNARAHEYRLDFKGAADLYLQLAAEKPRHQRTIQGLYRAEKLAKSDENWSTAARSAIRISQLEKGRRSRQAIDRGIDYSKKAGLYAQAEKLSLLRIKSSPNSTDKFKARLELAKAKISAEEVQDGQKILKSLGRDLSKVGFASTEVKDLTGEVYFLRAEDILSRFNDFRLAERSGSLIRNTSFKMKLFERSATLMDKSIDSKSPEWSSRARFTMAVAAGDFADEIAKRLSGSSDKLSARNANSLNKTIDRLNSLKTSYHSQNVLSQSKNPASYRGNVWTKRSADQIKGGRSTTDREDDHLPIAVYSDMSNVWSH